MSNLTLLYPPLLILTLLTPSLTLAAPTKRNNSNAGIVDQTTQTYDMCTSDPSSCKGIIAGALIGGVLLIAAIWFFWQRRKKAAEKKQNASTAHIQDQQAAAQAEKNRQEFFTANLSKLLGGKP